MGLPLSPQDWFDLFMNFAVLSLMGIGGAITTAPEMHRFLVTEKHWLTELIILEFLTPHGSQIATTVAILSPLFAKNSRLGYFFNANNPQGESYSMKFFRACRKL